MACLLRCIALHEPFRLFQRVGVLNSKYAPCPRIVNRVKTKPVFDEESNLCSLCQILAFRRGEFPAQHDHQPCTLWAVTLAQGRGKLERLTAGKTDEWEAIGLHDLWLRKILMMAKFPHAAVVPQRVEIDPRFVSFIGPANPASLHCDAAVVDYSSGQGGRPLMADPNGTGASTTLRSTASSPQNPTGPCRQTRPSRRTGSSRRKARIVGGSWGVGFGYQGMFRVCFAPRTNLSTILHFFGECRCMPAMAA